MDKSNAGQRVLGARRVLRGADDSLENILALPLPDGAQCFVLEEQASYRLIKNCELAPDEHVVVKPVGPDSGRWVRESGLVGFALLSGGVQTPEERGNGGVFGKYTKQQLVQFAMSGDTTLVYTGTVKRLALVGGMSPDTEAGAEVQGERVDGFTFLKPGDQILLRGSHGRDNAVGSLQVVLI